MSDNFPAGSIKPLSEKDKQDTIDVGVKRKDHPDVVFRRKVAERKTLADTKNDKKEREPFDDAAAIEEYERQKERIKNATVSLSRGLKSDEVLDILRKEIHVDLEAFVGKRYWTEVGTHIASEKRLVNGFEQNVAVEYVNYRSKSGRRQSIEKEIKIMRVPVYDDDSKKGKK